MSVPSPCPTSGLPLIFLLLVPLRASTLDSTSGNVIAGSFPKAYGMKPILPRGLSKFLATPAAFLSFSLPSSLPSFLQTSHNSARPSSSPVCCFRWLFLLTQNFPKLNTRCSMKLSLIPQPEVMSPTAERRRRQMTSHTSSQASSAECGWEGVSRLRRG